MKCDKIAQRFQHELNADGTAELRHKLLGPNKKPSQEWGMVQHSHRGANQPAAEEMLLLRIPAGLTCVWRFSWNTHSPTRLKGARRH